MRISDPGSIADWVAAVAACVNTLAFLASIVYVIRQWKESRLIRDATVIEHVYDYIMRTRKDRQVIYNHETALRAIRTEKDLTDFEATHAEVMESVHQVANCYHYLGFLLKEGLLSAQQAVLAECGHTASRMHGIIGEVLALQRVQIGRFEYKQYFNFLIDAIEQRRAPKF